MPDCTKSISEQNMMCENKRNVSPSQSSIFSLWCFANANFITILLTVYVLLLKILVAIILCLKLSELKPNFTHISTWFSLSAVPQSTLKAPFNFNPKLKCQTNIFKKGHHILRASLISQHSNFLHFFCLIKIRLLQECELQFARNNV